VAENNYMLESVYIRSRFEPYDTEESEDTFYADIYSANVGSVAFKIFFSSSLAFADNQYIWFKDPWYIDPDDSNYQDPLFPANNLGADAEFLQLSTPFSIEATNDDPYKGVLLNVFKEDVFENENNMYKVKADQSLFVDDRQWYFSRWDGNSVSFISPTSTTTPLVFGGESTEVWPVYKGHLASNEARATGFNNSRQMARESGAPVGQESIVHFVYEDNDEIWYTFSDDDGETWQQELRISGPASYEAKYSNPSIALSENYDSGGMQKATASGPNNVAHVVWEKEVSFDGVIEKGIEVCSMDFETKEWQQPEWLYTPAWGFGDPVSASRPIVFVGGGTSDWEIGRNIQVAFKRDSDDQILFTYMINDNSWVNCQEIPGAFGVPVSSQLYTTTNRLFVVWADDGEIKHAKATWDDGSNSYSWSSVNNLTGHGQRYFQHCRQPSHTGAIRAESKLSQSV